jgi:Flp pilus assembly protein TadD
MASKHLCFICVHLWLILPAFFSPPVFAGEKTKSPPSPVVAASPASAPDSKTLLSPDAQRAAGEGVRAFERGDLELARKDFEKLLQAAPDSIFGLTNLGAVEYREKKFDDAEKHLKRAVRLQPEGAPAWLTLGALYCDQEKLDAALAALSQAVLLDPKNARAHNYLGVTIGKKGWYSGAEAELRRALELQPDYAEANFNLALAYLQRTPPSVELARRHYARALELGAERDPLIEKSLAEEKK